MRISILALLFSLSLCYCSKVLVLLPVSQKSQKIAFDSIVEELARRKHDVTYVAMYNSSKEINEAVKTVVLSSKMSDFLDQAIEKMYAATLSFSFIALSAIVSLLPGTCNALLEDDVFIEFMKNPGKYDVVIVNSVFNECYLPVADKIGAPIVMLSVPQLLPNLAWMMDIPNPISYLPVAFLPYNSTMTFFQRLTNLVASSAVYSLFTYAIGPISEKAVQKYIPDAPSTYDITKSVSLILVNTHVSFEGPRPSMPYMIEVGCIHCNPGKKLPNDLETFISGSGDDGFIVFSLGSVVKGSFMSANFVQSFLKAFGQMKQRVIWKYEKKLDNVPPNVLIVSWLPQQDLMAHPKCKCAITHGGLLSLQEVAYHGVPLLGIPLGADRVNNIYRATKLGFALPFDDWANPTAEGILNILNELIYNSKYREKAEELSNLMKDRPEHPVETSRYWIEYVIRNKGARHLKSGAQHLNVFQYFLIDVLGFIAIILLVFILILFVVMKFLLKRILRLCGFCKPNKIQRAKATKKKNK